MGHTIYLALGANLGNRLANLKAALAALPPAMQERGRSPVYETEPWGYADQPTFLNMAVQAETELSPGDLLVFIKQVENDLGRKPSFLYGPRAIDIDILFYDDLVMHTDALTIPHPRLHQRAFVLVPLVSLAPELIHPELGRSVAQLAAAVDRRGVNLYRPFGEER